MLQLTHLFFEEVPRYLIPSELDLESFKFLNKLFVLLFSTLQLPLNLFRFYLRLLKCLFQHFSLELV